jgi:hypothetical protein
MLHKEAVPASTLALIKTLQTKDYLKGFYLAGGTALALILGHRKSLDIDLFSDFEFDAEQMLERIHQEFDFRLYQTAVNTLKGTIDGVNVDIIAHRYPRINDPVMKDDIQMLSVEDIIAMKLNAISVSGERSKDFIDIYFLLKDFSISSMLSFYRQKYNQPGDTHILKSLLYFDDVDASDWPMIISSPQLKWIEVRKRIEKEVIKYLKYLD